MASAPSKFGAGCNSPDSFKCPHFGDGGGGFPYDLSQLIGSTNHWVSVCSDFFLVVRTECDL